MSARAVLPVTSGRRHVSRRAQNGTLILGGGFGGAHVARLLGTAGATIVDPEGAMLFTPLLPEVAAGAVEPRHALVPLRVMCPHAELVRGRAVALHETDRTVAVETELGVVEIGYKRLVIALGSTARMLPIPGLEEHAVTFKDLGDAIHLRNHVIRKLEAAEADPTNAFRTSPSSSSGQAMPAWRPSPRRGSSSRTPCDTSRNCDTLRNGGSSSRRDPRFSPRSP